MSEPIQIEVIFAYPERYFLKTVSLMPPVTVEQVIRASGVLEKYPEIDLAQNKVGIFSRPVKLQDEVQAGERIEIYRPLLADPKEIRRKRAQQQQEEEREKAKAEKARKQAERRHEAEKGEAEKGEA